MQGNGQDTRLTIVSRLGAEQTSESWLEPLQAAWTGVAPEGRVVCYDTLCKELSPHDPCEPGHRSLASQVVVALASEASDEQDIYRLLDALRRSITPAVLIVGASLAKRLDSATCGEVGVSVLPWDTSPREIARVLRTLLDRQPLIDSMSREVRLAQLSQRSIAGELDKLHKELHEAAHMQKQFVQRSVPFIPGLDVGVIFRPATYVSGDMFDVERLDEHHVSIFLADAVGHGVPAAMLTLFISRAMPKIDGTGASARIVPPGEALARLNREFCGRPGPSGRFATAVYAVIDTRTMTATVAGAGHPHPIVVDPVGGSVRGPLLRIEAGGPLLGVFPDGEFESESVDLSGGKRMVLFTDGFETAFPDIAAGPSKLKMPTDVYIERLSGLAAGFEDAESLARALKLFEGELDQQMGSLHRPDDVTALIISHDPSSAEGRLAA
jgi:sigma-B regulation protein RsbU (phosphoserine phosphatase)